MKFALSKKFTYDIQECVPHFFQFTGKCEAPPLSASDCHKNGQCPTITMTTVMACDIEEACKKVKEQFDNFIIDKVIKFTKPAMGRDSDGNKHHDPTCNVDVTPSLQNCVECCDLLEKPEEESSSSSSSSFSSSESSSILSSYIGNISLAGPRTVLYSMPGKSSSSPNVRKSQLFMTETTDGFVYYGSGAISFYGTADVESPDGGTLFQNIIFSESLSDILVSQSFVPIPVSALPQVVQTVKIPCSDALFTITMEFKHTLHKIKPFASFLKSNNLVLPGILRIGSLTRDFIKLSYFASANQWRGNLHYEGQSPIGSFRESWDIGVQFGCLNESWRFLLSISNVQPTRRSLSRLLLYYRQLDVCPIGDAFFGFKFIVDSLVSTPLPSQPIVLNDEAEFFKDLRMVFRILPQNGGGSHQTPADNTIPYDASIE